MTAPTNDEGRDEGRDDQEQESTEAVADDNESQLRNEGDYESVFLDEHDDLYPTMHRAVMDVASTYNCISCIDDAAAFPNSPPVLERSHAMRGYAIIVLQCIVCGTTHNHTVYL